MISDPEDPETVLTDHMRLHYIELPRIRTDRKRIPENRLLKWAYFFNEEGIVEENDIKILIKDDPIFEKAHETFHEFTASDELRELYEGRMKFKRDQAQLICDAREEGLEKGRNEGILQGREQGLEQGCKERNREIAHSMKKNGLSPDLISETTGLSLKEIEEI